ncbi:MAG: hypothetical protein ABJA66_16220 [Actinomycetota bacterium]
MSFIDKKNLFIAIATFLVGTFAVVSFFGFSLIKHESTVLQSPSALFKNRRT